MTNKTETWREACRKLQDEGVKFEYEMSYGWEPTLVDSVKEQRFLRIKQQPIPNRQDWRDWCENLIRFGLKFGFDFKFERYDSKTKEWAPLNNFLFSESYEYYRIAQQPIPENIGDLIMEEKPEPKEEIPHRELQIQWHKDKLHSLETGEPMREWEWRNEDVEWQDLNNKLTIGWHKQVEYRRKPKVKQVTYWHCMAVFNTNQVDNRVASCIVSLESKEDLILKIKRFQEEYPRLPVTQITETTVEIEVKE